MVKELQKQKSVNSSTETETKRINGTVVSVFENGMNNDLDVKTVFDSLYETIHRMYKMRKSLSVKDAKNIIDDLHRIDSVLQFIF
jgi:hypothetical protein